MSQASTAPVRIVTQHFGNAKAKELATYESLGGYAALRKALAMQPAEIVAQVKAANLRGRGGAGFPAGVKWGFIPADAKTTYLVVNADEGEPGTFKDRWLMYWDPHRLIEGAAIAAYAIRSHKVYIYVRGELYEEAAVLERAAAEARARGLLGASVAGSGYALDVVVHRGAGAYICGEETALLNSLEGRRGWPRLKPPYPAIKGLFGEPTVVNNVETLMNVPTIIERGGEWFASLGLPGDGGTRAVAISGNVVKPGVYEVPVGQTLLSIINDCAGGVPAGRRIKGVIPGGSSFPVMLPDELDVPYATDVMVKSDKIREVEVTPGRLFRWGGGKTLRSMAGSGAIVVIDDTADIVEVAWRIAKFYAHESCGQCTPCREGTGWMAQILKRLKDHQGRAGDVELLSNVANGIAGNTICALGDGAAWPTLAFVSKYRAEFEAHIARG